MPWKTGSRRVHDDALGKFYAKSMANGGTAFVNDPVSGGDLPTSRSMIFVSPDGERSMNTYLGISTDLGPEDVPDEVASGAKIIFLEGYLFDKDQGKQAFLEASRLTRAAGGKAGIAISDPFCVNRHRADFLRMIGDELDYVIGNEAEIRSLFETDDLEDALARTAAMCSLVVCTRSGDGVTSLWTQPGPVISLPLVSCMVLQPGAIWKHADGWVTSVQLRSLAMLALDLRFPSWTFSRLKVWSDHAGGRAA